MNETTATDRVAWPAPPEYEYPPSLDDYGPEACILTFGDGREVPGSLLEYAEGAELLRFKSAEESVPAHVPLDTVHEVRLQRPVLMKRRDRTIEKVDESLAFAAEEMYGYSIALHDGVLLAGETIGFIKSGAGVYLFPPESAGRVLRRFIAARAVQSVEFVEPQRTGQTPAAGEMKIARLAEVYRDTPDKYPYGLQARFGRVLNRIAELWLTPQLEHYFNELLVDKRGGRQGFPPDIMSELMAVYGKHAAIVAANAKDPLDPWGFEAMRKELKEIGVECTPKRLLRAVESGDVRTLSMLIAAGLDVNEVGDGGWTPLMVAAFNGQEQAALMLIDAGATVNARDRSGYSPLHWAAMNGYLQAGAVLLRKGAIVNLQNNFGWTPLLHAAGRGHHQVVKLLLDNDAHPDLPDKEGWTPLHKAAVNGHVKVVEALLDGGANQNLKHKDGATPLALATQKGHQQVRAVLLAQARIENADRPGGAKPA
jgi:ankyrin repeat protein